MKTISIFLIAAALSLLGYSAFAQETPPSGVRSVNGQFYINVTDSSIWHNKGAPYGWERLARYKELLNFNPTITGGIIYRLPAVGDTVATGSPDQVFKSLYQREPRPNITPISTTVYYELANTTSFPTYNQTYSFNYAKNLGNTNFTTGTINGSSPFALTAGGGTYSNAYTFATNTNPTITFIARTSGASGVGVYNVIGTTRRYWGRAANITPTQAEILAAAGGGSELNGSSGGKIKSGIVVTASGSNRPFFAWVATAGPAIKILDVNGFDVTSDFLQTSFSFTNASGYVFNIQTATLNNPTLSNYTFSVTQ